MKWEITSFNAYYIWKVVSRKSTCMIDSWAELTFFFSWNIIFTRNKMTTKYGYSDLGIWWTFFFFFFNKKSVISKEKKKGRQGGKYALPNVRIRVVKAKFRILENLYMLPCLKASEHSDLSNEISDDINTCAGSM